MPHPSVDQQITFIFVTNLDQSAQFYEQTLGFSLWLDQGSCRIYEVLGRTGLIGICQSSKESKGAFSLDSPQNVILTIVTEEVDAWYEHLSNRGVTFEKTPSTNPRFRIYHCFLRDPDGYLIEIQRFLDH